MNYKALPRFLCLSLSLLVLLTTDANAEAYKAGTFSIKPLNANLTSYWLGRKLKDSKFRTTGMNYAQNLLVLVEETRTVTLHGWRAPLSFGFSESDRNGVGYGIEAGYVLGMDWEIFGRAGYCHERPKPQFMVGTEHSFKFKPRNNWGMSLGLRRYFDQGNAFKPYLATAFGFVSQGETKLSVFAHPFENGTNVSQDELMFVKKMAGRKALFSFELSAGADYVFNQNWALSGSVAVRYNQRGGSRSIIMPAVGAPFNDPERPLYWADHKQRWYIPVTLSLKIMF